jgi:hypothetical protein
MENKLESAILKVCSTLNSNSVQYLLVGGIAVGFHGYYRPSVNGAGDIVEKPDLDFWYNPTYENYFRLLSALEELGQDVTKFKEEQSPNPLTSFFKYEFDQFTLDLLPRIKADIKFRVAFEKKESIVLEEVEIPFISLDDLIKDKSTDPRQKDVLDIERLNDIRED